MSQLSATPFVNETLPWASRMFFWGQTLGATETVLYDLLDYRFYIIVANITAQSISEITGIVSFAGCSLQS
jgi:hypothetical protein